MSNMLRIGGLVSGMDIDQIVKDLMKAQRMRVDSIKQKRQQVEWKRDDYRTLNSSLMTLRNTTFNMKLEGTYKTMKATSGNENVVKVSATSTASTGIYTIKVDSLAEGAYVTSTAAMGSAADKSTLQTQFGLGSAEDIKLSINGVELTINTGTDSIYTLTQKINELKKADGTSVGINANYDANLDRIFLNTTATGSAAEINLSQVTPDPATGTNMLGLLKIDSYTYPVNGKNAKFDLNGTIGLEQSSNEFTISGVKYTLTGTSAASVTVQITRDTDAVYNSIKSFIEQYNTTIDLINKELTEERYSDFLPLTDDQREELSDDQEKKWEEKAQSGILRNDSLMSGIISKIRSSMSGIVSGISSVTVDGKTVTHNSLSAIGIITKDYTDGGKLYLKNDGADLKKAIESDQEGIIKLFTQDSSVSGEVGIARRLYNELDRGVDLIIDKASVSSTYSIYDDSTLGKQLRDYDKQISAWETRLVEIEDRYWRQFTAMEKAISQMNAQSAWLSQQLGGSQ
ncbi:MAG: flagellar filament capping protein FliD [Bacillota bacterium]